MSRVCGVRRISIWSVIVFAFAVLVSACGAPPALEDVGSVKRSELIGTWRGEGGAVLVLGDDGKFGANSLNTSYVDGAGVEVISKEVIKGKGDWVFGDYGSGWMVDLSFKLGGGVSLRVASLEGSKILWAWVGDGEQYILRK